MSLVDELAKLEELHRRGALSADEFTKAKAALLGGAPAVSEQELGEHLADQLAEVKYQNELARIDREWQIEREQYMVYGKNGRGQIATPGASLAGAFMMGAFGITWTVLAFSMSSGGPGDGPFRVFSCVFPLFGVLFTCFGVYMGLNAYAKAQKYQEAFAAYQARRARAKADQVAAADRPRDKGESSHDIKPA
jgi:hypothetical protein